MSSRTNCILFGTFFVFVTCSVVVSLVSILSDDERNLEEVSKSHKRAYEPSVTINGACKIDVQPDRERKSKSTSSLADKTTIGENSNDLIEDKEQAELDEFQREILRQIKDALDENDIYRIRAALAKLRDSEADKQKLKRGALVSLSKLPVALRKEIVDSLGWFGYDGMSDIVEFIADEDPEIAEDAMSKFESALQDVTLSDREKAEIVVMASQVITDRDALESLFMEFSNMRHSVGIEAILAVSDVGTVEAKSLMPENMEFFTGEEDIDSREKAEQWLRENPDDECDEEFYGGWKDE